MNTYTVTTDDGRSVVIIGPDPDITDNTFVRIGSCFFNKLHVISIVKSQVETRKELEDRKKEAEIGRKDA